jgi:nicotinamidase-related amidase
MPAIEPVATALLVMDYQPGIVARVPGDADGLLARVARLIGAARGAGVTIAYVRVAFTAEDVAAMPEAAQMRGAARAGGQAMAADSPSTQIDPRIAPVDGDIVVRKTRVGAFSTTDLDGRLRERGIDTLLLAGISTSGCVLSTIRDAADRDYRQLVVGDACADPDPEVHAFLLSRIFARHSEVVCVDEIVASLGA